MEVIEYRSMDDNARLFLAIYGARRGNAYKGNTPVQFFAAHFAGISTIGRDEFIRVMNGAGKALLREGIDCRTPAEFVRSELHRIRSEHAAPV